MSLLQIEHDPRESDRLWVCTLWAISAEALHVSPSLRPPEQDG